MFKARPIRLPDFFNRTMIRGLDAPIRVKKLPVTAHCPLSITDPARRRKMMGSVRPVVGLSPSRVGRGCSPLAPHHVFTRQRGSWCWSRTGKCGRTHVACLGGCERLHGLEAASRHRLIWTYLCYKYVPVPTHALTPAVALKRSVCHTIPCNVAIFSYPRTRLV